MQLPQDIEKNKMRELQLQHAMYSIWLNASGETNEAQIRHLKNCVSVAFHEALTERQQQLVALYMSGYSGKEIAAELGINPSTVSRTLHRALKRLVSRIKYATPRTLPVANEVLHSLTKLNHM